MLIFDTIQIGNKLLQFRKKSGLTQAEVAEAAGLSDRTYADIERGTVNMKIETVLRICGALKITPNEILTEEAGAHFPTAGGAFRTAFRVFAGTEGDRLGFTRRIS